MPSQQHNKIGLLGAGNMGSAFYDGLRSLFPSEVLYVADKNAEKLAAFSGAHTSTDFTTIIDACDVIILAIKPFDLEKSFEAVSAASMEDKLIISMLTGASLARLTEASGAKRVIRVMPNLAVKVGKGVTAWFGNDAASTEDKAFVEKMLAPMGAVHALERESQFDAVTAVSGSGPAYFFYLCEALTAFAKQQGFSEALANKLAAETCISAAALLEQTDQTAEQWRRAVTSKKGTTDAALSHLEANGFVQLMGEAMARAKNRSEELSNA